MPQQTLLKIAGLYTYPSHLAAVPTGALLKAKNLVINRDSVAESRRGFKIYGTAMTGGSSMTAHQLLNYKNRILRHYGSGAGTTLEYDSDGAGTFTPFTISLTATKHSNTTVDGLTSTSQLEIGMTVSGTGIPANTTISSITSNTAIIISNAATDSATSTLTFTWVISELTQGKRIRSVEQNGNFYFTTSNGIKKLSLTSSSDFGTSKGYISQSGGIKALDFQLTLNTNPGFLSKQSVVAYRIVWGITDNNSNVILGSPSARNIIRNSDTSNSMTVNLQITIPQNITTAHFYQIYRTAVFSDTLGTQDPGDECQLVYENNPVNSDLTNGFVSVIDITPETFRQGGAFLYTNQTSGEGILQSNDVPPLANDITSFKSYTFYSNTRTEQQLNISLLSVSTLVSGTSTFTITDGTTTNIYTFQKSTVTGDTTNGSNQINNIPDTSILTNGYSLSGTGIPAGSYIIQIVNGTTIKISQNATATNVGTNLTFATESISGKKIAISQFATPAQQVDETARSLVRIINRQASELVYAYYISGPSDVPGLLLFQGRRLNANAFYLNVDSTSTGNEFSPTLPTSGNTVISTNETSPNRLYFSKLQQPEAVPSLNFIDVGPKDKAIIRILALRDNLFILKEDGVYRLSGVVAPFTVYPFDFSTIIKATDSAVVLNNLLFLYTSQGIVKISDTGIEVISRKIEDSITKLLIPDYTNFATSTFGVSYESDRSYYLFTVTNTTDTVATQCFRYNTFTDTWTQLDISKRCGIVNNNDDKLYLGAADTNYIEQERKSFDRTDYADREIALTLGASSVNGVNITLSSVSNINVGDVLVQTQYLTINKFNQLLSKLDRDSSLTNRNYVSTLTAISGDNLSSDLDNLITAIANDAGRLAMAGHTPTATYTALIPTGVSFSAQQTNFNSLISLLNNDPGVGYKNYTTSTGTVNYEFNIITVTTTTNIITANYSYPLIQGPLTVYNNISVELQWVPQFLQDVSMSKHTSEATLIFEDSGFTTATLSYSTDLSANFEDQSISGSGNGLFGNIPFGKGIFGGNGSGIPFRTLIPKEKQRCRYINCKFKHAISRENFSLYGMSITYNPISQRAWR